MAAWDDYLQGDNSGIWNPSDQWNLDPATGQYQQAPPVRQTAVPSAGAPASGFDPEEIRRQLQAVSQGVPVSDADVSDAMRINQGETLQSRLGEFQAQYDRRAKSGQTGTGPDSTTLVGGGGAVQSRAPQYNMPGMQFDDAYSNLLEQIAQKQMGEVRSNPGLDQLMQFLTKQFQDLSTNPGYNADERALLNTQAFEPIEANRQASMQRARERAAARGFAPSSGLMELDLRDVERAADQARTVAGRDLAIAGLDRRDRDLSRALDLGQMLGVTIPRSQRGEEVALGNLLYQMPRTALNDALGVISGTPSSSDAFSQAIQLLQQQYQQQGRSDANNAALYGTLGQLLAGFFR